MGRLLSVLLASLGVLVLAAPPADAGTASGTFTIHMDSDGPVPARDATYTVDGAVLAARAMTRQLGSAAQTRASYDNDGRYVAAMLTHITQAASTTPCPASDPGSISSWISGVREPRAAMELDDTTLNLLHGSGSVRFGVADVPDAAGPRGFFAPGTVNWTVDDACEGGLGREVGWIPLFSHGAQQSVFDDNTAAWILLHRWPLHRTHDGAWTTTRSIHRPAAYGVVATNVSLSLSLAGSATSLHALCVMPTVRDLRGARSQAAALGIVTRAGFRATVGSMRSRPVPSGHWFIAEGVGNTNPYSCGWRLHLMRSRGW